MSVAIPKFLSHLPVHQGLPVLFTAMWIDGVPDFRIVDHDKKRICVNEHLCAICGKRLGEYLWLVGGPSSLEGSSLFMDPPQHEHCARYAIETCPFLSGRTTESNRVKPLPTALECPYISPTRSEKIGMRRAKSIELVNYKGYALIHVTRWSGRAIWLA